MANLGNFWKTLELRPDRSAIMHDWNAALGETLETLKIFLRPTEERVEFYPNPKYPECHPYYVVAYRNGTVQAVSENRDHVIDLEPNDIVKYRWDMLRFRKLLADVLKINPASDTIKKLDCTIRLGNLALAPGEEYPVYMELVDRRNFFKDDVSQLLLKLKTPFIVVTGTRMFWDDALMEVLQERNIPLLPLSEALEFCGDKFVATDVWRGAVEAFRKTLYPENMVAVLPYEFRRKGQVWVVRYDGQELFLKDNDGPRYIAMLLANPGRSLFAIDMHRIAAGYDPDTTVRPESGDDLTDRQTIREAEEQSHKLLSELDQARRDGDRILEQEILDEIEKLANYLCETKGYGGKMKKNSNPADSIRRSLQQLIKGTIQEIEKESVECAQHFRKSISTGLAICYDPSSEIRWSL